MLSQCCANIVKPTILDRQSEPDIVPMLKAHAGRGPANSEIEIGNTMEMLPSGTILELQYWGDEGFSYLDQGRKAILNNCGFCIWVQVAYKSPLAVQLIIRFRVASIEAILK